MLDSTFKKHMVNIIEQIAYIYENINVKCCKGHNSSLQYIIENTACGYDCQTVLLFGVQIIIPLISLYSDFCSPSLVCVRWNGSFVDNNSNLCTLYAITVYICSLHKTIQL